jgi:hypothetical protein
MWQYVNATKGQTLHPFVNNTGMYRCFCGLLCRFNPQQRAVIFVGQ